MNYLGMVAGSHLGPRTSTDGAELGAETARGRYDITPSERGRLGEIPMVALLVTVLAAEVTVLVDVWDASHRSPGWLVLLLGAFLVVGELSAQRIGRVWVSSATGTAVLAIALLGPAPAALLAAIASLVDSAAQRKRPWATLTNATVGSLSALAGGLLIEDFAGPDSGGRFVTVVFLAGIVMTAINILLIGAARKLRLGASFRRDLGTTMLPLAPYVVLSIMLATGAAQMAVAGEVPVPVAVVPALLVSEFLLRYVARERAQAEEVVAGARERADLLEQALTAEVAEREWIAAHVHDDTLQTLAVVRQDLEEAEIGESSALATARGNLDDAVSELRRTLMHVHPGSVHERGLAATLDAYASQALRRGGANWSIDVQPSTKGVHQALLYSVARELLSNAGKHSGATHVDLQVTRVSDAIRLRVQDDGVGFPLVDGGAAGHFGLLITRRRVAAAGGRMTLGASPSGGAMVDVELPTAGR